MPWAHSLTQKKRDMMNCSAIIFKSYLYFGFINRCQSRVEGKMKVNEIGIYHVRKLKDVFFINAAKK